MFRCLSLIGGFILACTLAPFTIISIVEKSPLLRGLWRRFWRSFRGKLSHHIARQPENHCVPSAVNSSTYISHKWTDVYLDCSLSTKKIYNFEQTNTTSNRQTQLQLKTYFRSETRHSSWPIPNTRLPPASRECFTHSQLSSRPCTVPGEVKVLMKQVDKAIIKLATNTHEAPVRDLMVTLLNKTIQK